MGIRSALAMLTIVVLSGCASSPEQLYAPLKNVSDHATYGKADVIEVEAIRLPDTIHGLSMSRQKFHISEEDPVISFGDYKSNYKLFYFDLNDGDEYVIKVVSLCDCLGFDKKILVPEAYVVYQDGVQSNAVLKSFDLSVGAIWLEIEGKADSSGRYYLVLAANNSSLGKPASIEDVVLSGYIPTGISVASKSNPYGEVIPSFELKSEQ